MFSRQCNRSVDRVEHAIAIDFRSACMAASCGCRLVINRDFFLESRQVADPQVDSVAMSHRGPGPVCQQLLELALVQSRAGI
jgi:hypothetical protein